MVLQNFEWANESSLLPKANSMHRLRGASAERGSGYGIVAENIFFSYYRINNYNRPTMINNETLTLIKEIIF
jgi:hypothetical protein